MAPLLDVLIPCFAPSAKLDACITSVLQHTRQPFNLIVTVQQQSVAANRNALLLQSRAPYVCFLDDDVEMPEGWAEKLIETYETFKTEGAMDVSGVHIENPRVGMVGPRIIGTNGERQNQSFDVPEGEQRVEYVCGAVMLWKREDWPWLFADPLFVGSGFEDTDLTMQMLMHGGVPVVDGRVTVKHHNGMVNGTGNNWEQNSRLFAGKWGAVRASRTPKEDA